jgi:hypothetical protein
MQFSLVLLQDGKPDGIAVLKHLIKPQHTAVELEAPVEILNADTCCESSETNAMLRWQRGFHVEAPSNEPEAARKAVLIGSMRGLVRRSGVRTISAAQRDAQRATNNSRKSQRVQKRRDTFGERQKCTHGANRFGADCRGSTARGRLTVPGQVPSHTPWERAFR